MESSEFVLGKLAAGTEYMSSLKGLQRDLENVPIKISSLWDCRFQ